MLGLVGVVFSLVHVPIAKATVPSNTSLPTISGQLVVGNTLTASNGTWANSPTSYTYRWKRCTSSSCTDITAFQASNQYTLQSADSGYQMRVAVQACNSSGCAIAYSAKTATVTSSSGGDGGTPSGNVIFSDGFESGNFSA